MAWYGTVHSVPGDQHETMTSLTAAVNVSVDPGATLSTRVGSLEGLIRATVVAVISCGIILSNIVNLVVLVSARGAMPSATRLFLINLSSSDLLVGIVSCAPAVLPAAAGRWTYGDDHLAKYTFSRVSCQIGLDTVISVQVSRVWSIGLETRRLCPVSRPEIWSRLRAAGCHSFGLLVCCLGLGHNCLCLEKLVAV